MKFQLPCGRKKSRKPFCDFLLGVPLWWGGGYSVVNAFYCVTWYREKSREPTTPKSD